MQLSFDNRTYLITGGGSGIGKGVAADRLTAEGLGLTRPIDSNRSCSMARDVAASSCCASL